MKLKTLVSVLCNSIDIAILDEKSNLLEYGGKDSHGNYIHDTFFHDKSRYYSEFQNMKVLQVTPQPNKHRAISVHIQTN